MSSFEYASLISRGWSDIVRTMLFLFGPVGPFARSCISPDIPRLLLDLASVMTPLGPAGPGAPGRPGTPNNPTK